MVKPHRHIESKEITEQKTLNTPDRVEGGAA